MSAAPITLPANNSKALPAILFGGLACGILDMTGACVVYGLRSGATPQRIMQSVASGVLGPNSYQGGVASAALGLALHFVIALLAAAAFYLISRQISFLIRQPIISGIAYGVVVYFFMGYVVVPLSAAPKRSGAFSLVSMVIGVTIHILCVGLPISLIENRFLRQENQR